MATEKVHFCSTKQLADLRDLVIKIDDTSKDSKTVAAMWSWLSEMYERRMLKDKA